jgi:hypothetical protein
MTLNPESWLRRQVWRILWQGPGAVSIYLSIPTPLICVALSLTDSSHLAVVSLFVLSVNLAFGVLFILADELDSCLASQFGASALLRREKPKSSRKTRDYIERGGSVSKYVVV